MNYEEAKELIDKIKINVPEITDEEYVKYNVSHNQLSFDFNLNLDFTYEKLIDPLLEYFPNKSVDILEKYSTWLMSFGINFESDTGWASFESLKHDNMKLFIYNQTKERETELNLLIEKVQKELKSIQKKV